MGEKILNAFTFCIILMMLACVPTPEEETVLFRGDEDIDQLLRTTPEADAKPMHEDVLSYLGEQEILETVEDSSDLQVSKMKIEEKSAFGNNGAELVFDTDVLVPTVDQWAVYRIEPSYWKNEDYVGICTYFAGEHSIYKGAYEPTKEQIASYIARANESETVTEINRGFADKDFYSVQEILANYYQDAPVEHAFELIDWSELDRNRQSGMQAAFYNESIDTYMNFMLNASRRRMSLFCDEYGIFTESDVRQGEYLGSKPNRTLRNPFITKEEACKEAENLLTKLGIKDMMLSESETEKAQRNHSYLYETASEGWMLVFRKQSNGIPCIACKYQEEQQEGEEYILTQAQEKLSVYIDSEGIWYFEWQFPSKLLEKRTDTVSMLSFAKIMDLIKRRIQIENQWYDSENILQSILVTDIALGYCAIPERNQKGNANTIPVWVINYEIKLKNLEAPIYHSFAISALNGTNVRTNSNAF